MVARYLKIWLKTGSLTASTSFNNRMAAVFFILGKWIRFSFFIYFITVLGHQIQTVKGYSTQDLITFYLVFNLFDLIGQLLFRGIYWFSDQIISGEFDFRLIKPINPLFQVMTRETDLLDMPLLVVVVGALIIRNLSTPPIFLLYFMILTLASILIITAIHIIVAALGVITTEVDHTIMIYRDLSAMARFPVDMYSSFIRSILTFVIPISIAFTVPAKALLGLANPFVMGISLLAAGVFLGVSLKIWDYALTKYSSASS